MAESREEAALKAGWRPYWEFTKEARASQWAVPQLSLRIWCSLGIVTVISYVEWMGDDGRLVHHTIATAKWRAKERPTEEQVVEWGYKALGRWLGDQLPTE